MKEYTGWVKRYERELTDSERDALQRMKHHRGDRGSADTDTVAPRTARGISFDIGIDHIVKPPTLGLRARSQLYILEVSPTIRVGFELCFMDMAVATGSFPSSRVCVAFAVRRIADRGWENAAPGGGAISFAWGSEQMDVIESCERPPYNELFGIYRLEALEEAAARFRGGS